MRVFVNELALGESCANASPPYGPLESLLVVRRRYRVVAKALYCSKNVPLFEIRPGVTISRVVQSMPRDARNQLFAWVAKMGPFIEDDRLNVENDLFLFDDLEVTDGGLGEAARRILLALQAAVFSVIYDKKSRFLANPLKVAQGFHDEPISLVDVPNYCDGNQLAKVLSELSPEPSTWNELLSECRERYDRLLVGEHCNKVLISYPYNPAIARRIRELFAVLQEIMIEMNEDGSLTESGNDLLQQYFVGERALFTDESERRKTAKWSDDAFTFPDPEGSGNLVCHWHGKISTQYFRIHFEWPVPAPRKRLKIAYIGRKIV